jgi:leader peptidase (prepilin peptidase) / N-methyltransferase
MNLNLSIYLVLYSFIFILGTLIGSFLNCVIFRLESKKSFLKGRSYCPHCKHQLCWFDLIPIFSFILLKGKCRYCNKKISWQYPVVELVTGLLFFLVLNYEFRILNYELFSSKLIFTSLFLLLTSCFLIIIFVYDLKHFIIPDKIIYPLIAISFFYRLIEGVTNFQFFNFLVASAAAFAFFFFIYFISKGKWLGFGDVKLVLFLGLFLGWPKILLSLFLSFVIGAIIGIGLIIFSNKGLKSQIPFGPFLILGSFIAFFWGNQLINWYLGLIYGI